MIAGFGQSGPDLPLAEQIYEDVRIEPMQDSSQVESLLGLPAQPNRQPNPNASQNQPNQPNQPNPVEAPQLRPFIVASNVFRIYGDGMLEDIMVRVEAYVWRTPTDMTDMNAAAQLNPEQPQEAAIPVEPFRILSWKVIR